MTVFRTRRRRWPALVGVGLLGLAVGIAIGYAVRGGGASFQSQAADAHARADEIGAILAVVGTEYPQGVGDTGRIIGETEYAGSRQRVADAAARLDAARADLQALDARAYARARRDMAALAAAVDAHVPPAGLAVRTAAARDALAELAGR